MTFIEKLRDLADSSATAFHLFLLEFKKYENPVFAFFEGKDDLSFYNKFITNRLNNSKKYIPLKCGNKKEVYETYKKVIPRVKCGIIVLFFVDRDFSDFTDEGYVEDDRIYVTDYYSIENYVVTVDIFTSVCQEILHLSNEPETINMLIDKFQKEITEFYIANRYISAWIIYMMREGNKTNIKNVNLNSVFSINDDLELKSIGRERTIQHFERSCGLSTPDDFGTQSEDNIKEIEKYDEKMYVRGKFELYFFVIFIRAITNQLKNDKKRKDTIRTHIDLENAIDILGPRVQIPESLEKFLKKNLY